MSSKRSKIKFSEEWDKLKRNKRIVSEQFTTFRAYEWKKDKYYYDHLQHSLQGTPFIFDVELNGIKIGSAILINIEYKWSHDVSRQEIMTDTYKHWTHHEWFEFMEKFYKLTNVFLIKLTFQWIDEKEV